jgi:hypothetical protein
MLMQAAGSVARSSRRSGLILTHSRRPTTLESAHMATLKGDEDMLQSRLCWVPENGGKA